MEGKAITTIILILMGVFVGAGCLETEKAKLTGDYTICLNLSRGSSCGGNWCFGSPDYRMKCTIGVAIARNNLSICDVFLADKAQDAFYSQLDQFNCYKEFSISFLYSSNNLQVTGPGILLSTL